MVNVVKRFLVRFRRQNSLVWFRKISLFRLKKQSTLQQHQDVKFRCNVTKQHDVTLQCNATKPKISTDKSWLDTGYGTQTRSFWVIFLFVWPRCPAQTFMLFKLHCLTCAFAPVIIATATRGRHLTTNANMGQNALLGHLTYMVVFAMRTGW